MSDLLQHVIAMEQHLLRTLDSLSGFIWGLPLCALLIGTGLFLTFRLRGIQITHFSYALYLALIKRKESDGEDSAGEISHFQALMTALSATVGTGNIVGVATAIGMGGPGALFWMWVTGLVGMATKYTEAVLAVHYRETDDRGEVVGGPMYYLRKGISGPVGRVLAFLFAVFAVVASFGIGNLTQANSVADALQGTFELDRWITALILVLLSALVILGGIRWIGKVTSVLVPIMIVFYMTGALIIFFTYIDGVPAAFQLILERAFAPDAAGGGFIGVMVSRAVEYGVKRGVFSNESGLGSSPIAAAAARTKHPVTQALVSMTQTFIDTLVVCSLTGFAIILTGSYTGDAQGIDITMNAFAAGLGQSGPFIVAISQALFAYSTVLGWSYYGEKCLEYLMGSRAVLPYRIVFILLAGAGALASLRLVWLFSDIFNGLMALPNLIGLLFLSGIAARITREYFADPDKKAS